MGSSHYAFLGLLAVVGGCLWLVSYVAAKREARRRKPQDPADRALVNLLIAMGHNPKHCLFRVVRQGRKTGLQVLTLDGRPLRFYRLSELERMKKDPAKRHLFAVARSA